MLENFDELKHIKFLIENKNMKFASHNSFLCFTSGKIGPYYVNSVGIEGSGELYKEAVKGLAELVERVEGRPQVISGGESRDWDFSNPVAVFMGLPHTKIYKKGNMMGAMLDGKRVAHVADLNNKGYSPSNFWIPAIRNSGGFMKNIFFYIDKDESGAREIRKKNVESHSLIKLDNGLWEDLLNGKIITSNTYERVMEYRRDPEMWAKNVLRSNEGFENLSRLPQEKIKDILNNGYPDMKCEIGQRLSSYG